MSPISKFPVRLFHVQKTAKQLRNNFPYFTHHDSVSLLWSQKWRPNCAKGIYPFFDGDVSDFDPIFAELVRNSNDNPAIFDRPDEYAAPFLSVAKELINRAEKNLRDGDVTSAKDLFLRAAAVCRIARFPVIRSDLGAIAWEMGKAAYEKAGNLFDSPNLVLEIPFAHADSSRGDRAESIRSYLRLPKGPQPATGWPVLLFICGLDAYKTDNTPRIEKHIAQGFATITFEIPGTGDCPAAPNDPTSPDRLMSSVLDWVVAHSKQHGFNTSKICARGISTGGYYAYRIAHTHADRLLAVVGQGGGGHFMFNDTWIEAQNGMEYPFALAEALAWKFGYRDRDFKKAVADYKADAGKFSLLDSGILDRKSTKLLCVNGMNDSIFPIEDSLIVAMNGGGRDLIAPGDQSHMGGREGEEVLYSWLGKAVADELTNG